MAIAGLKTLPFNVEPEPSPAEEAADISLQLLKRLELVNDELTEQGQRPRAFKLRPSAAAAASQQQLRPLVEDSQGHTRWQPPVTRKYDALPVQLDVYAARARDALEAAEQRKLAVTTQKVESGSVALEAKRQQAKRAREEREVRDHLAPEQREDMTEEQMMGAVLRLFEKQDKWLKRDVQRITNQADALVNWCLGEVAVRIASGEFKNHYVLKEEFKIKRAKMDNNNMDADDNEDE